LYRAKIAHSERGWKGDDSGDSAERKAKTLSNKKGIHLTPAGLLMEGVCTQGNNGVKTGKNQTA
jgi:hypothetical protein